MLPNEENVTLLDLLREFRDVFAWTYSSMLALEKGYFFLNY